MRAEVGRQWAPGGESARQQAGMRQTAFCVLSQLHAIPTAIPMAIPMTIPRQQAIVRWLVACMFSGGVPQRRPPQRSHDSAGLPVPRPPVAHKVQGSGALPPRAARCGPGGSLAALKGPKGDLLNRRGRSGAPKRARFPPFSPEQQHAPWGPSLACFRQTPEGRDRCAMKG